jgi:hypothetical protein
MRTNGFFDSKNFDSDAPDIKKALMRQSGGIDFTKKIEHEGEMFDIPWKRFTFIGRVRTRENNVCQVKKNY